MEVLTKLVENGVCEFIGSGYTQLIGPLVPSEVNHMNLRLGNHFYKRIFGRTPDLAMVNEMAYSAGIVEHYVNNGYQAIIMEWNNPSKYNKAWDPQWRYFPQVAIGTGHQSIPLIWADSIAFQKFQRYAHGEYTLSEYLLYLTSQTSEKDFRYFPLYANDAEVFNYRPGRYPNEHDFQLPYEWDRIDALFEAILNDGRFQMIAPSAVLQGTDHPNGGKMLRLETPDQPIPVKKQEKYNINRWALTGRDDLMINTLCHRFFNCLRNGEVNEATDQQWQELCYLWSSDFRTHITSKRWHFFKDRLIQSVRLSENSAVSSMLSQGQSITLPYIDTDFCIKREQRYLIIETRDLLCTLNLFKGLAIEKLSFKKVNSEPLIGTLPHGYYEDISLGADFFSGHTIIEKPGAHKITDLCRCAADVFRTGDGLLYVYTRIDDIFSKCYIFDAESNALKIQIWINLKSRFLATIHTLNVTFFPTAFDRNTLWFSTHNGGSRMEQYRINSKKIHHSESLSSLISARHGLGATEGTIEIGDENIKLRFKHDQNCAAIIPAINFLDLDGGQYFLRLQYSAQELDETFKQASKKVNLHCELQISCS